MPAEMDMTVDAVDLRRSSARSLGRQGGDLRDLGDGAWIDLSTCVNGYGPPPSVDDAMAAVRTSRIRCHPYDIADRLRSAFAAQLGVAPGALVVGRGTTEFIWSCRRLFDPLRVGVPRPAYTDFVRAFPMGPTFDGQDGFVTSEDVERAMAACDAVLISNPSNPTGKLLAPDELVSACRAHPRCCLIVDESYADFWPDPSSATVLGAAPRNLLVLRSPSKFYGIAGVRTGAAWSNDERLLRALEGERGPWPISQVDGEMAIAAVASEDWAAESRRRLTSDGAWLERALDGVGLGRVDGAPLHYRLWRPARALSIADALCDHRVVTRILGAEHGFSAPVIRVAAPTVEARPHVATAFAAVRASLPAPEAEPAG
jgi:histidinol-phosphate/aromatic aminotransferase/cobyric acid decarboxylase-like protein